MSDCEQKQLGQFIWFEWVRERRVENEVTGGQNQGSHM